MMKLLILLISNILIRKAMAGDGDLYFPSLAFTADGGCIGTLIHSDVVLTSAQCKDKFLADGTVYIGGILKDGSTSLKKKATQAYSHPAYDPKTNKHDILLIKLSEPVTDVVVQQFSIEPDIPLGELTLLGFDSVDKLLIRSTVTVQGADVDNDILAGFSDTNYAKDTKVKCASRFGSPLLNSDKVQIGIFSHGVGCGTMDAPATYTRLSDYQLFIASGLCMLSSARPLSCDAIERTVLRPPPPGTSKKPPTKPPTTPNKPPTKPNMPPTTTKRPTTAPKRPTTAPSAPSASPTKSAIPSTYPSSDSDVPSSVPSNVPSSVPSNVPSSAPSSSDLPSSVPSDTPSLAPSVSTMPTGSSMPSSKPTYSIAPSTAPSAVPSTAPSAVPSSTPSDAPTTKVVELAIACECPPTSGGIDDKGTRRRNNAFPNTDTIGVRSGERVPQPRLGCNCGASSSVISNRDNDPVPSSPLSAIMGKDVSGTLRGGEKDAAVIPEIADRKKDIFDRLHNLADGSNREDSKKRNLRSVKL